MVVTKPAWHQTLAPATTTDAYRTGTVCENRVYLENKAGYAKRRSYAYIRRQMPLLLLLLLLLLNASQASRAPSPSSLSSATHIPSAFLSHP
jgi:hypothetical protein